uniref:Gag protein n=1 Tax=Breu errantivirus TaxID=3078398 RepID=A0AB38Z2M0_9VIRU
MPRFTPYKKAQAKGSVKMAHDEQTINFQAFYEKVLNLEHQLELLQIENSNLRMRNVAPVQTGTDIFRIPDPIKQLPSYDGNKRQLNAWLTTAMNTLDLFKDRVTQEAMTMYEQIIINKIEGKARDTICANGNPTKLVDVAEILKAVYGDKSDIATYQTQLWSTRMEDSLHIYYRKMKEILQNMKTLCRQNELFVRTWEGINVYLEQEALAAFINGLNKQYFGHAQASKPADLESAYAFLCKFQNAETTKHRTSAEFVKPSNSNHNPKYSNNKNIGKPNQNTQQNNLPNQTPRVNQNFNKPKPSDRQKVTPMEVDASMRSHQPKFYNHEVNEKTPSENEYTSDEENECEDTHEQPNFQIATQINPPR